MASKFEAAMVEGRLGVVRKVDGGWCGRLMRGDAEG